MPPREYIDFKLYLTRPSDGQGACQVSLLPTPEVGETIAPVTVPATEAPPDELLAQLASGLITLSNLAKVGKKLGNCLLPEGVIRNLFLEAFNRAGPTGGVRLRLIIADHRLKPWPWEYAYLNRLGGADDMCWFLALEPRVSIVRHEPLPYPHPVLPIGQTAPTNLRMVLAAASPKGQPQLRVDKEVAAIQEALKDFNVDGVHITVDPALMDATGPEVVQALRKAPSPFIFHFAGHGGTKTASDWMSGGALKEVGYLLFVGDKVNNSEDWVNADEVAKVLQAAGVRLAVLGACKSGQTNARYPWDGVAGALAAREVPAIIAMQYPIEDTMARIFSRAFYAALSSGVSLDEAVYFARAAMLQQTSSDPEGRVNTEWGVPVLYSRLPDGAIAPELTARKSPSAEQIRNIVQQNVDRIAATGRVVGVQIGNMTNGSFSVVQTVGDVSGTLIGVDGSTGGAVSVTQEAKDVDGTMIGYRGNT